MQNDNRLTYVYVKCFDKCIHCDYSNHTNVVIDVCKEFFGDDLTEYSKDDIHQFILNNIELGNSMLYVQDIAIDIATTYGRCDK